MNITNTIDAAKTALQPGQILVVTVEQLRDFALTVVETAPAADQIIDIKECAKLLGISTSHAYTMVENNELPVLNMRPFRFSRNQVLDYLKNKA